MDPGIMANIAGQAGGMGMAGVAPAAANPGFFAGINNWLLNQFGMSGQQFSSMFGPAVGGTATVPGSPMAPNGMQNPMQGLLMAGNQMTQQAQAQPMAPPPPPMVVEGPRQVQPSPAGMVPRVNNVRAPGTRPMGLLAAENPVPLQGLQAQPMAMMGQRRGLLG